jgi:hypothetical protein
VRRKEELPSYLLDADSYNIVESYALREQVIKMFIEVKSHTGFS